MALCLLLAACMAGEPPQTQGREPSQAAEAGGPAVHTDWSRLGEREVPPRPVGTRWYEEYTDHLIPRNDYGPLIPYAGLRLMDDWPADSGCLYGLMTREGKVVTDPVYSRVYRPGSYDASGRWRPLPLLVLKQGDPHADEDAWDPAVCAVAAADGSWCTPFDYRAVTADSAGLLLFQPDSLTVMTAEGEIRRVWTAAEMGISRDEFDSILSDVTWGEGWGGQRHGDYMALGWEPESDYTIIRGFNLVSGGVEVFSQAEWDALSEGASDYPPEPEPVIPDAVRKTDQMLGYDAPGLLELTEYSEQSMTRTYYREDGAPLPGLTLYGGRWYEGVSVVGGLIEVLEWNTASYYDLDTLECRFRTCLNYEGD